MWKPLYFILCGYYTYDLPSLLAYNANHLWWKIKLLQFCGLACNCKSFQQNFLSYNKVFLGLKWRIADQFMKLAVNNFIASIKIKENISGPINIPFLYKL